MKWIFLWLALCDPTSLEWKDYDCIHEHQEVFTIYRLDGKNDRQIITICDIVKEVE